ncbi:MAG: PilZ domain-containing protein [Myxococcota bacterium]
MNEYDKKRRHNRIDTPTIKLHVATEEKFRRRYLRDLSQGGVYIRTHDVQEIGSEIRLELLPPGWDAPLRIRGEVVRIATVEDEDMESTAVGMGVQFRDVGPKNREMLAELLSEYESNAPRFSDDDELPDDIDSLQREVRALRVRLSEARSLTSALYDDIETLEEDDDTNRAIIERLVRDKRQLEEDHRRESVERIEDLQQKHARELRTILDGYEKRQRKAEQRWSERLTELEKQNTTLQRDLQHMTNRAERAEQDFRELHTDLQKLIEEAHHSALIEVQSAVSETNARNEDLSSRLARAEDRLQKVKKKERELRRLVAMMSGEEESEDDPIG